MRSVTWVIVLVLTLFAARSDARELQASELAVRADTSDTHGVRVALDLLLVGARAEPLISAIDRLPTFNLVRNGQILYSGLEPQILEHGIRLVLPLNGATLAHFRSFGDLAEAEIRPDRDFTITLGESDVVVAPAAAVASATRGQWAWAADSLVGLWRRLDVAQTGNYLGNFFDIGRRTGKNSNGEDVFAARFSFTSPFGPPRNVLHAEGDWSTLENDSTNRVHIDPVNVRITAAGGKASSLSFRSGIDCGRFGYARQGRFTAGLVWESLVPNLLDLTGGEQRFRLKPVVTASVEGHGEWSDRDIPDGERNWGMAKVECDYDVPVFAHQLVRMHVSAHFPFKNTATRQDLKYEYSLRFLSEVAGGKLQPGLSFSNGADDVNRQEVTRIFLGLWFDTVPTTGH